MNLTYECVCTHVPIISVQLRCHDKSPSSKIIERERLTSYYFWNFAVKFQIAMGY
jgi:hypothetical protein